MSPATHRRVPIGASTVASLASHRERMKSERFYGPERVVFCDTIGGFIRNINLLHRHFEPACRRAGLKCRFYDLRHAHVSNLLDAGVSLPAVAARAGHGSSATTAAVYAHAMPTGQGKAVNVSEAIISGGIAPIGSAGRYDCLNVRMFGQQERLSNPLFESLYVNCLSNAPDRI